MAQTYTYDKDRIDPNQSDADLITAMNTRGAGGWRLVEVDGHECMWMKEETDTTDVTDAITAQGGGGTPSSFTFSVTTSWQTLSSNAGNSIRLINTDTVRTIYYRFVGDTHDGISLLPVVNSVTSNVRLLVTNSNLIQVKCDLLTATLYAVMNA